MINFHPIKFLTKRVVQYHLAMCAISKALKSFEMLMLIQVAVGREENKMLHE
jgi:hypothetical protein